MRKKLLIQRTIQILIIFTCFLIILFQNIKVEIKTIGKVIPQSDYRLIQDLPNGLRSELNHYLVKLPGERHSYNFERKDVIDFDIINQQAGLIQKGEEIGIIHSDLLNYEIINLEGQIRENSAILKSNLAGEKQSIIEEAENNLKLQQTKYKEQKLIVCRLEELKQLDLVSDQEYEIAKGLLDVYEIKVLMAKSNLNTVKTGAKTEDITIVKEQINILRKELKTYKNKKKKYTIKSPIPGILLANMHSDTLLTIENHEKLGVMFPVKLKNIEDIVIGQTVELLLPELKIEASAKIVAIEQKVNAILNHQVFIATAELNQNTIPSGSQVKCKIQCGLQPVYKYLIDMFRPIEIN